MIHACGLNTVTCEEHLSEIDLHKVQTLLWDTRSKWHNIGLALGVDPTTLEAIKRSNHHVVDDCFKEMLLVWLRRANPIPCWKALADALRSPSVGVHVEELPCGMFSYVCSITYLQSYSICSCICSFGHMFTELLNTQCHTHNVILRWCKCSYMISF